jgi:hypothetical protein
MRFLIGLRTTATAGPPPPSLLDAIGKFGDEATSAGALVATGGLLPSASGARIRAAGGKLGVGPLPDTERPIGAYAVYDVASKDEAIEWTSRFMQLHLQHWPGWEGEADIQQIFEPPAR